MPDQDTSAPTTTETPAAAAPVESLLGAEETAAPAEAPAEDTPAEETEEVGGAPDQYEEFVIPEGLTATDGQIADASAMFKELGLTQAQAQKLVDFESSRANTNAAEQNSAMQARLEEINNEHIKAVQEDPDMGGVDYKTNVAIANKAIRHFGGDALVQALVDHHMASHPEVVKAFWIIGNAQAEDTVRPGAKPALSRAPRTHAQILYDQDHAS